jgi:hypothetical protein
LAAAAKGRTNIHTYTNTHTHTHTHTHTWVRKTQDTHAGEVAGQAQAHGVAMTVGNKVILHKVRDKVGDLGKFDGPRLAHAEALPGQQGTYKQYLLHACSSVRWKRATRKAINGEERTVWGLHEQASPDETARLHRKRVVAGLALALAACVRAGGCAWRQAGPCSRASKN